MSVSRLVLFLSVCAVLVGCKSKPHAQPPAQTGLVSEQVVQNAREFYTRQDPDARVGQVLAIRPDIEMAAVGEVNLADFHKGEAMTFVDAQNSFITMGVVDTLDTRGNLLLVKYDVNTASVRAPRMGDLAVRFKHGDFVPPAPAPAPAGSRVSADK